MKKSLMKKVIKALVADNKRLRKELEEAQNHSIFDTIKIPINDSPYWQGPSYTPPSFSPSTYPDTILGVDTSNGSVTVKGDE